MPLPNKRSDEENGEFMSRCMSDPKVKQEYPDSKQRTAVCMNQSRGGENISLINKVHDTLLAANQQWDDEWEEFVYDIVASEVYDEEGQALGSEYQGRKVQLNKPFRTPDGPKKFSVYVKNDKGNVVKVNFGDPNMKIKKNIPERRKSFRARHNCDNPGPKWKARYWSCKAW
jgi:hypothetical protein